MEAHGVPALIKYQAGEISRDEALTIGQTDTRHTCQAPVHLVPAPVAGVPVGGPHEARGWLANALSIRGLN